MLTKVLILSGLLKMLILFSLCERKINKERKFTTTNSGLTNQHSTGDKKGSACYDTP